MHRRDPFSHAPTLPRTYDFESHEPTISSDMSQGFRGGEPTISRQARSSWRRFVTGERSAAAIVVSNMTYAHRSPWGAVGLVVDHSTTPWTGHQSVDESVDGTPRQRTWDYPVDGFRHLAQVR